MIAPDLISYPNLPLAQQDRQTDRYELYEDGSFAPFKRLKRRQTDLNQDWKYWRSLRRRFFREGEEGLSDQDALEILLAVVSPVSSRPKTQARALLTRFGNLAGVLGANPRLLSEAFGDNRRANYRTVAMLKIVQAAAVKLMRNNIVERSIISSFDSVVKYCQAGMAHQDEEQFRILFLNKKNMLILDELHGKGTVDHVPLYPRKVAKRALELGASAIIMVHNHPSGDPSPSAADIEMTRKVIDGLRLFDILVHDHIIVGAGRHISFRSQNLI